MNSWPVPKAIVVLGAGASYDIWNGITPINDGNWRPPLTRDLFGDNRAFFQVRRRFPGALELGEELGPLVARDAFAVETALHSYAEHANENVRRQFRSIPPYLREIIRQCTYQYLNSNGCYAVLAKRLLGDFPHRIAFVVMNYDTLLERALQAWDKSQYTYRNSGDYTQADRPASVVKLHGSINWVTPMPNFNGDWIAAAEQFDFRQSRVDVRVTGGNDDIENVRIGSTAVYPVLTAPLAGKGLHDVVCPEYDIQFLQEFIRDCGKFLFIGSSGLDTDLLEILNQEKLGRPWIAHYVGGSDVATVRTRFEGGIQYLPRAVERAHFEGFREYVFGPNFEEWLRMRV